MKFETGTHLIDYITENNLLDTPWNANPDFSPKYRQVWFGDIEFYKLEGTSQEVAIVHHVYEKAMMDINNLEEIDKYCGENAFMTWLVPSIFKGMILYTKEAKK